VNHRRTAAAEVAFTVVALLAGTLGPVYQLRILLAPMADSYAEDQLVALMFCVVYVIAAIAGARATGRVHPLPLFTTVGLTAVLAASTLWSPAPALSATQAVLAAMTLVLPWYLARRWTVDQVVTMAWVATSVGVALSAAAVAVGRANAVDAAGDWAGIYYNRNSLGPVAGLCLVLGLREASRSTASSWTTWLGTVDEPRDHQTADGHRDARADVIRRAIAVATVLLSGALLYGSGSKSSILSTVGVLAAWAGVELLTRYVGSLRTRLGAVSGFLAAMAAVLVLLFRPLARALGSDDTLQGRTELWSYLARRLRERPLTGDGWLAVYTTDDYWYWGVEHLSRNVATAHNGLVEVAVGGGVVAFAALLGVLWFGLSNAVREVCGSRQAVGGLVVAMYFMLANSGETFIGAHHLPWVLFLGCCVFRWTPSPGDGAVDSDVPSRPGWSRR